MTDNDNIPVKELQPQEENVMPDHAVPSELGPDELEAVRRRTGDIFVYMCLCQQLEAYSYVFNGILNRDGKFRLHNFQSAAKQLMRVLNSSLPEDALADRAEVFSRAIELIFKAPSQQKAELHSLMQAWVDGKVKVEQADEITEETPGRAEGAGC